MLPSFTYHTLRIPTVQKEGIQIIRGFSYDLVGKHPYIWVQNDNKNFSRLNLRIGVEIDIEVGELYCQKCFKLSKSLFKNTCHTCLQENYQTRLKCMYNKKDSILNSSGSCSRSRIGCGDENNKESCYSKHVVYIGRFGNLIKVGVSKKNRVGTYLMRIIEQGLNEAIIIDSFPSLKSALHTEERFKQMGIPDRHSFDSKVEQIKTSANTQLSDTITISSLREHFPNKKIMRIKFVEEVTFPNLIISRDRIIKGKIVHFQGSILVTLHDGEFIAHNLSKLIHRNIKTHELDN